MTALTRQQVAAMIGVQADYERRILSALEVCDGD